MTEFFERIHVAGIPYAVLRNYDTLPEKPDSQGDVDFLISEQHGSAFQKLLQEWVTSRHGAIFFTRHRFHCASFFIFIPGVPNLATWIDAFTMIATRGIPWLDTDTLLRERVRHEKGFFTLSAGAEAASLMMKEILAGKSVRTKYQERIRSLLTVPGALKSFTWVLSGFIGKSCTERMFQFASSGQWQEALNERKTCFCILLRLTFRKEPVRQMKRFFQFFYGHLVRTFFQSCRGGIIAVLGPDGVGKTTACRNLQERLRKWPFRKVFLYHGEFGVFPKLSSILSWFKKSLQKVEASAEASEESIETKHHRPAGSLRAFIHLIYYGIEFFLAWPWVLWGTSRGYLLIFDRFYYDFAIRSSHRWLYRLIIKIIPRPKLIILLKAPSALVYERKQELTINQIEEQLQEFQERHQHAIIISTEQTPEAIVSTMEEAVAHHFSKSSE